MPPVRFALAAALGTLLLAGCGTSPYPYSYGTPPGSAERDSVQTLRGNPQARVILREGPVLDSDTALSPEESAREDAGKHCASAGLEARVLDLRKERMPARVGGFASGRNAQATEYERVQLTFVCEIGRP